MKFLNLIQYMSELYKTLINFDNLLKFCHFLNYTAAVVTAFT